MIPRKLENKAKGIKNMADEYTAYEYIQNLFFINETIVYMEEEQGTFHSIKLDGYAEFNYLDAEAQIFSREGVWPNGRFENREIFSSDYLNSGQEVRSKSKLPLWQYPKHMSMDQIGSKTTIVYVDLTRNSKLNWTGSVVYVRNMETGMQAAIPETGPFLNELVDQYGPSARFNPQIADSKYVLISEHYFDTKVTALLLYFKDLGSTVTIYSKAHANSILPQIASGSTMHESSPWTFIFWVETDEVYEFNHTIGGLVISNAPKLSEITLNIVVIPYHYHMPVPDNIRADWYIWDSILSSTRLFVLLCNRPLFQIDDFSCAIESLAFNQGGEPFQPISSFRTIFESPERVQLQSASESYLVYWSNDELFVFHDHGSETGQCKVPIVSRSNVSGVAIFYDTIAWVNEDIIFLLDLDKDNDGVLDVGDAFPIDGLERRDSDNDGISDIRDLIDLSSFHCALNTNTSCTNDNIFLYSIWGVLTLICFSLAIIVVDQHHVCFCILRQSVEFEIYSKTLQGYEHNRTTQELFTEAKELAEHLRLEEKKTARKFTESKSEIMHYFRRSRPMIELKSYCEDMMANLDELEAKIPGYFSMSRKLVTTMMQHWRPLLVMLTWVFQVALDGFAVLSVLSGIYPLMATSLSIRTIDIVIWFDFYFTTIFAIDLIVRFKWFKGGVRNFFFEHWIELAALINILPGTKIYMSTYYREIQYLRGTILLRIIRVYFRLFQEDGLVHVLVTTPEVILAALLGVIVVCMSMMITQMEYVSGYPGLNDTMNSVWLSVSTATTVGYGDFSPATLGGRLAAFVLMVTAIGLIGTLSSSVAQAIQTVGRTEEKVKQLKSDNRSRFDQYKNVLDLCSISYNPVVATLSAIIDSKDETINTPTPKEPPANFSRSSTQKSLQLKEFPICTTIAERIGMNPDWTRNSTLGQSGLKVYERKRVAASNKFGDYLDGKENKLNAKARIYMLLISFGLDAESNIPNFDEFVNQISRVILEAPKQHELCLERSFALAHDIAQGTGDVHFSKYSIVDPLDNKLSRVEAIIGRTQYKLLSRVDFDQIVSELSLITIEYDRVLTCRWAIKNLVPKDSSKFSEPKQMPRETQIEIETFLESLPPDVLSSYKNGPSARSILGDEQVAKEATKKGFGSRWAIIKKGANRSSKGDPGTPALFKRLTGLMNAGEENMNRK